MKTHPGTNIPIDRKNNEQNARHFEGREPVKVKRPPMRANPADHLPPLAHTVHDRNCGCQPRPIPIIKKHKEIGQLQPGDVYIADLQALNVVTTASFQIAICGREGAICEAYTEATAVWLATLIEAAGPPSAHKGRQSAKAARPAG